MKRSSRPRLNCWEATGCGREPGGSHADEWGVCPAATATAIDGVHGGHNAGRACWAVTGTMCNGDRQEDVFSKIDCCASCEFFLSVMDEEESLMLVPDILRRVGGLGFHASETLSEGDQPRAVQGTR